MGRKYRITYDAYPQYGTGSSRKKKAPYLLPFLVCTILILTLLFTSNTGEFYRLVLPGDPDVTAEAFHQFAAAIDRGETLFNALDVFCETVMDIQ